MGIQRSHPLDFGAIAPLPYTASPIRTRRVRLDGSLAGEAPERWAGAGEGADRPQAWLYLGASLASALAAAWLWGAGLRGAR